MQYCAHPGALCDVELEIGVQDRAASAAHSETRDGELPARLQYLSELVLSGDYPVLAGALTGQHDPERPEELFSSVITNYLAGAGLPVAAGSP